MASQKIPQQPDHLQLKAGQLRVHTQAEEAGRLRLGKRVVEHTEAVSVALRGDHVIVERTRAESTTPASAVHAIGEDVQPLEIKVMRERLHVGKEVVVREAVTVRKETIEHVKQVRETVGEEQLEVQSGQQFVREERPDE